MVFTLGVVSSRVCSSDAKVLDFIVLLLFKWNAYVAVKLTAQCVSDSPFALATAQRARSAPWRSARELVPHERDPACLPPLGPVLSHRVCPARANPASAQRVTNDTTPRQPPDLALARASAASAQPRATGAPRERPVFHFHHLCTGDITTTIYWVYIFHPAMFSPRHGVDPQFRCP